MNYYMLTWKANWADEMDVNGFIILNEKEYEKFIKNSKKASRMSVVIGLKSRNSFEVGVGSDEYIYYDNTDELFNSIFVEKITEEEYEVFKNHNLISFGETGGIKIILDDEGKDYENYSKDDYDDDDCEDDFWENDSDVDKYKDEEEDNDDDEDIAKNICLKDIIKGKNFR